MLIKCGLSHQNFATWVKNESEGVRLDLKIIASKSKHAPITSKIIYSIIEIFKSIFGSSNYQKAFLAYKTQATKNLENMGHNPSLYKNKDYKKAFKFLIERQVKENDLQIEGIFEYKIFSRVYKLKEDQQKNTPETFHPLLMA